MPARGKRSDRPGVPSGPPGGADRRGGGAAPGDPSLLYGRHAVTAALANPARRPKRLWATRDALEALAADGSL